MDVLTIQAEQGRSQAEQGRSLVEQGRSLVEQGRSHADSDHNKNNAMSEYLIVVKKLESAAVSEMAANQPWTSRFLRPCCNKLYIPT